MYMFDIIWANNAYKDIYFMYIFDINWANYAYKDIFCISFI